MEVEERERTAGPAAEPAAQPKGFSESEGEDAEEARLLKPMYAQVFHQM